MALGMRTPSHARLPAQSRSFRDVGLELVEVDEQRGRIELFLGRPQWNNHRRKMPSASCGPSRMIASRRAKQTGSGVFGGKRKSCWKNNRPPKTSDPFGKELKADPCLRRWHGRGSQLENVRA